MLLQISNILKRFIKHFSFALFIIVAILSCSIYTGEQEIEEGDIELIADVDIDILEVHAESQDFFYNSITFSPNGLKKHVDTYATTYIVSAYYKLFILYQRLDIAS